MPKYKVTVTEEVVETFELEVEAENEEAAEEKAEELIVEQPHVAVSSATTERWAEAVEIAS
jgi:predicted transcriptional regulator